MYVFQSCFITQLGQLGQYQNIGSSRQRHTSNKYHTIDIAEQHSQIRETFTSQVLTPSA